MSATQTALVLDGISAPLKKVTLPVPTPEENQVLLIVTAAGRKFLLVLQPIALPGAIRGEVTYQTDKCPQ